MKRKLFACRNEHKGMRNLINGGDVGGGGGGGGSTAVEEFRGACIRRGHVGEGDVDSSSCVAIS